jgi:hypothetical protein
MITATSSADLETEVLKVNLLLLDERIDSVETNSLAQTDLIGSLYENLSTQISHASLMIGGLSLIIAVISIALAGYINSALNKIRVIKREADTVKRYIDNNNISLYQKLQREETLSYLNRLLENPEDINNLASILFARELEPEDFEKINRARVREQLPERDCRIFVSLLLQHFPYETLMLDDTRAQVIENFQTLYSLMHQRDIRNYAVGLFKFIRTRGLNDKEVEKLIQEFISALHQDKDSKGNQYTNIRHELNKLGLSNEYLQNLFKDEAIKAWVTT